MNIAGGSSLCPSATFMPKPVAEMYKTLCVGSIAIIYKQHIVE
jgi:hypothetical protein